MYKELHWYIHISIIASMCSNIIGNKLNGTYNITFFPMHTNVTINYSMLMESDKTFNLTINSATLPSNVIVGDPDQVTVTIKHCSKYTTISHNMAS